MSRLFAIGDLHLSLIGAKPMDRFGELWRDHATRMAANWDRVVAPEDTVLLAGDLSWARNLGEAAPDLAWIGARPGSKLLLRGNHDGWWQKPDRVREVLPPCCTLLQNDAHRVDPWVVVGSRGWTDPDDPVAQPGDGNVFSRELDRLRLSIVDADRRFGRAAPRIALLHYPPWLAGREPTRVIERLRGAGVQACVYGHLHGDDHRLARHGDHEGLRFYFVAADAIDFTPVPITEPLP